MTYYKAVVHGERDYKTFHETVAGELLTEKERNHYFPSLSNKCFTVIDIPSTSTYFFFGCRFEYK